MKKWHQINVRTRKTEVVTVEHVRSEIESRLKYSRQGANNLIGAAVTTNLPIRIGGDRFEFREV